jgi:hypothetical protein
MLGHALQVPLPDGRTLWGLACPEHGLRYSCPERRGGRWNMAAFVRHNGQATPVPGERIACSECREYLAYAGGRGSFLYVPDVCLDQLREVARGLGEAEERDA